MKDPHLSVKMSKVSREKLREVYDQMDKNDDNTLSYHELKACIMKATGCSDDDADIALLVSQ